MSTVFGIDINEIQTGRLLRSKHVSGVYEALGGVRDNVEDEINFTGSAAFGENNTFSENAVAPNFMMGSDNTIDDDANNVFIVGSRGLGYGNDSLILSSGNSFLDENGEVVRNLNMFNGASQHTQYVRSARTTAGNQTSSIIQTRRNTFNYVTLKSVLINEADAADRAVYEHKFGFLRPEDPNIPPTFLFNDKGRAPKLVEARGAFENNDYGVLGDVNMDGFVTQEDVDLVQQFVVGLEDLSDEQKFRADVNGDGNITSFEAALILQYVSGQQPNWIGASASRSSNRISVQVSTNSNGELLFVISNNASFNSAATISADIVEVDGTPQIELIPF